MKTEHSVTLYITINSKWIKDLNVRLSAMKFLWENIGRRGVEKHPRKIFSDPPPRIIKTTTNKWDLVKLKSFSQQRKL